ncbi:MAG TPA: hypothetical protein VJ978_00575 [Nitriliruptoraceae bacterium]|nr:hypothetical protein [Nitriliruptoraceae bacterium]
MDTTTTPTTTPPTTLEESRDCTRCDGTQHLVATFEGMGKYRCDTCELVVGFDLEADLVEFLLERGHPSRYTRERFGSVLMGPERRL